MEEKEERAGVKRAVKITPANRQAGSGRSAWEFQEKRKGSRFHRGSLQSTRSNQLPANASNEQVQLQSDSGLTPALGGSRLSSYFTGGYRTSYLGLPGPLESRGPFRANVKLQSCKRFGSFCHRRGNRGTPSGVISAQQFRPGRLCRATLRSGRVRRDKGPPRFCFNYRVALTSPLICVPWLAS